MKNKGRSIGVWSNQTTNTEAGVVGMYQMVQSLSACMQG